MGRFVTVGSYSSRPLAEVARTVLRAEGIAATIAVEDTAYDISFARGGARLMVEMDSAEAARKILAREEPDGAAPMPAPPQPIQFSLRALLMLTTLLAFTFAGYALNGPYGAYSFFFAPILATIGVQVLLNLKDRRRFAKPFVAFAGIAFITASLGYLLAGIFMTFGRVP